MPEKPKRVEKSRSPPNSCPDAASLEAANAIVVGKTKSSRCARTSSGRKRSNSYRGSTCSRGARVRVREGERVGEGERR